MNTVHYHIHKCVQKVIEQVLKALIVQTFAVAVPL